MVAQSLLPQMGQNHVDDFQTPAWAVEDLLRVLNLPVEKDLMIWEPACGNGNIVLALGKQAYGCYGTDIKEEHGGVNFLTHQEPLDHFDIIITNPPFSLKTPFLKKCYEYGKPFALLMPINAFGGKGRKALYKKYGIQTIFLPRRIDFEYPDGVFKKKPWFECAWFTWGFNLERDVIFL